MYLRQAMVPNLSVPVDQILMLAGLGMFAVLFYKVFVKKEVDIKAFYGMPALVLLAYVFSIAVLNIQVEALGLLGNILYWLVKISVIMGAIPYLAVAGVVYLVHVVEMAVGKKLL